MTNSVTAMAGRAMVTTEPGSTMKIAPLTSDMVDVNGVQEANTRSESRRYAVSNGKLAMLIAWNAWVKSLRDRARWQTCGRQISQCRKERGRQSPALGDIPRWEACSAGDTLPTTRWTAPRAIPTLAGL